MLFIYIVVAMINTNANISVRYYGPYKYLSVLLFLVGGIIGTILMKEVCNIVVKYKQLFLIKKIFCAVGKNSMPILALHWFLFSFCDILIEKCGITIFWKTGYSLFKIVLVVILCAGISKCHHIVRKKRTI